uniref:Uncharacterized protein n=1 Tax=viral metagenome TaxID=1070528 RepID=A0A6H1ZGC0_9ZZZZ
MEKCFKCGRPFSTYQESWACDDKDYWHLDCDNGKINEEDTIKKNWQMGKVMDKRESKVKEDLSE